MTRRFSCSLAVCVISVALLAGQPVAAHNPDPLERAPQTPADAAVTEVLTGEVKELIVEDRVANVTVRYRSLGLADGTHVRLQGGEVERLLKDSRVEVTGRRNGQTLFVSAVRELARAPFKADRGREVAQVEGELRMVYVDYFETGTSRVEFEVKGPNDEVAAPLHLDVIPEALQRGMRVEVRGVALPDGAIEPDTIAITALPDVDPAAKVQLKATKTDNVLVILMRFTDSPAQPFTQAQVQTVVAGGPGSGSVAEYFKEVSFGQQLLNVTVTSWLSTGASTPANCDWRTMGTIGRNTATAAGYTLANYHKVAYVFPRVPSCGWLGLAYIGGSGLWVNGSNTTLVIAHELGHNFGLLHAGSLDCGVNPIGGSCSATEYGEPFGVMGNQRAMHLNAAQKSALGWISSAAVKTHATGSATYTLNPIETAGGSAYAVKIRAAANRTYWLEYRQPIGFDAGLASYPNNGAQVRVATPFETLCSGCDGYSSDTQFVDMTPATGASTDGALLAGRSFTDATYGITFNVLSATATGLTVQVVAPGGAVTSTTTSIASSLSPSTAGASVAFTATVTGTSPTGAVAFTANGTTITGCGGVALAGAGNVRTAACVSAALTAGSHSIVASYGGNGTNSISTSAALSQTVNAPPTAGGTNVALASAGAIASASSTSSTGRPASAAINNERAGTNWSGGTGGWMDGTPNAWPDWLQVTFNGSKRIDRVVVYSVQNNWTNPVEPADTLTGSAYLVRNFTVQGWSGSSWITLATVTANTLIKRTVTFAAYTTDRIRINVTSTPDGASRITEVEAWGVAASTTNTNVALATAGATASASSVFGTGFSASGIINNERAGTNWGTSGGWKDATPGAWPDWAEVTFNGNKSIARVVVYSVQDNWTNPIQPTDTLTGALYVLRNFTVQGWNGSSWITLATVTANTLIKRTVTFAAYTTSRIRINVTSASDGYSRITEVEAWGTN